MEGIKEKKRVSPPILAKRGKLYTSGNAIPCQMTASSGLAHRLLLARSNGSKYMLVTCH